MTAPNTAATPSAGARERFDDAEALYKANTELLVRWRDGQGEPLKHDVRAFLGRAKATGAVLDDFNERQSCQARIDYWVNVLYRAGDGASPCELAPFDEEQFPFLPDSACPYRGLEAFGRDDTGFFFGRQSLVQEMAGVLASCALLAVVGPSGSGKSSAVRAGLLPGLEAGAFAELLGPTTRWQFLRPVVPGSDPLENLARALVADGGPTRTELRENQRALAQWLTARQPEPAILVIDQFEELFTLCDDVAARESYARDLLALLEEPPRHRVVLTMRSDFESYVTKLPELDKVFRAGRVQVTALNRDQLREAIEGPAAKANLNFERGLVDALIDDTLGEPAALPLLQFTLLKLWEKRWHKRNKVMLQAYRDLGGGRKALGRSADELYERGLLEAFDRDIARRILLRLVRPGDGLEVTSSRVPVDQLTFPVKDAAKIREVLEKLWRARLVRITPPGPQESWTADTQAEIAHEALVRNWERLFDWINDVRGQNMMRRRLEAKADEWNRLGRGRSGLLDQVQLTEAEEWLDSDDAATLGSKPELAELVKRSSEALRQAASEREAARLKEEAQTRELAEAVARRHREERLREEEARSSARVRQGVAWLVTVPLFLILLAPILVLYGAGSALGLPNIFWSDDFITRAVAGGSLALQATLLGVLGFYAQPDKDRLARWAGRFLNFLAAPARWASRVRITKHHGPGVLQPAWEAVFRWLAPRRPDELRPLIAYLGALAVVFVVVVNLPIMVPAWSGVPVAEGQGLWARGRAWWLGLAVGAIAGLILIRLLDEIRSARDTRLIGLFVERALTRLDYSWLNDRFARFLAGDSAHRPARVQGGAARVSIDVFMTYCLFLLALLSYLAVVTANRFVDVWAAMAACTLLGLIAATVAFLGLYGSRIWQTVVVGLACWAIFWNYALSVPKHRIDGLAHEYKHPIVISSAVAPPLPRLSESAARPSPLVSDLAALEGWKSNVISRGSVGKPKLAVIVTGGGGLRAGWWAQTVLERLDQEIHDFGAHVRVITGASGGMVGAAHYVAREASRSLSPPPVRSAAALPSTLPTDCLSPIVRGFVCGDLASLLSSDELSRGTELERSWPALMVPLAELRHLEVRGAIPSLVFSPVLVEDDRRLLISNLELASLFPPPFDSRPQPDLAAPLEFVRLYPSASGFTLASAARMSATFPPITPEVNLPTVPPRRVTASQDSDVFGLRLAAAWINRHRDWLDRNTSGIAVVLIDAPPSPLFSEYVSLVELFGRQPRYAQSLEVFWFESTLPTTRSWYVSHDELDELRRDLDAGDRASAGGNEAREHEGPRTLAELVSAVGAIDSQLSDELVQQSLKPREKAALLAKRDAILTSIVRARNAEQLKLLRNWWRGR